MHAKTSIDGPSFDVTVEVLRGIVRACGQDLTLSRRERQVAVAIAVHSGSTSEQLCDLLYPGQDWRRARTVLKVYVHRLRKRAGRDFIAYGGSTYQLGPNVGTDIGRADALLGKTSCSIDLVDRRDRDCAEALARSLRAARPAQLIELDWYYRLSERYSVRGRRLAMAVARSAMRSGEVNDAIRVCRELLEEDPCDEEARELLIRAHASSGERAAALTEFRTYRTTLARELQAEPSRELHELVHQLA
jgi:DNA-binding SARP family transcriptional activator